MNEEYTHKLYKEALLVAQAAHQNQRYDEIFPYEKHLLDVVDVLKQFGFSNKYLIAGLLHDTLEDTLLSYSQIRNYFGPDIAEIVYLVTDEVGRTRPERHLKTYEKMKGHPDAITIKLANIIANVQHGGKSNLYSKEYPLFRETLYSKDDVQNHFLWIRLQFLLDEEEKQ